MAEPYEAELVDEASSARLLSVLLIATLLVSAIFLALAYSPKENTTSESIGLESSDEWRAFSVVAPIDTGINVYHDHFRTCLLYTSDAADD